MFRVSFYFATLLKSTLNNINHKQIIAKAQMQPENERKLGTALGKIAYVDIRAKNKHAILRNVPELDISRYMSLNNKRLINQ